MQTNIVDVKARKRRIWGWILTAIAGLWLLVYIFFMIGGPRELIFLICLPQTVIPVTCLLVGIRFLLTPTIIPNHRIWGWLYAGLGGLSFAGGIAIVVLLVIDAIHSNIGVLELAGFLAGCQSYGPLILFGSLGLFFGIREVAHKVDKPTVNLGKIENSNEIRKNEL